MVPSAQQKEASNGIIQTDMWYVELTDSNHENSWLDDTLDPLG